MISNFVDKNSEALILMRKMTEIEFIQNYTNRGGTAAIHDGFTYIKDKNLSYDRERYKCSNAPKWKAAP